jgi:hypothetical protein
VAELVGQRARPVLADVAARVAEAVPDRTNPDLVAHLGDAAQVRVRTDAVGGEQADVSIIPVPFGVINREVAQRGLAVGPVIQQFGDALQVVGQLGAELRVDAGVPVERDGQVEQDERVVG